MILDIYDSPKRFDSEFEFYCFKNCFRQILDYYRVKNATYYIDCSTDWTFQFDNQSSFGFKFSTGDFYSSFLPPFDNKIIAFDSTKISIDKIWSMNKETLAKGVPLVVSTDGFHLNYTPYYQKKHFSHSLLLCGFSDDETHQYIVDWYLPWFYKGIVSKTDLDQARASENPADGILSGKPINYMWSEVESDGWIAEDRELISVAMNLALDRFYTQTKGDGITFRGCNALNAVLSMIEKNFYIEASQRSKFLEDLHGKLYFIPMSKTLFKYYLQTAFDEYGFVKLGLSIKALNELISRWKKVLYMIIKCSMINTEENYMKLICFIKEIIIEEKNLYYTLYEANKSINVR